jgi:hypothetical protein
MELNQQIEQQRVQHIITSYELAGEDAIAFYPYLHQLLATYSPPIVELALVESLVEGWLQLPMLRGCEFLSRVHDRLLTWQANSITSTITPEQFLQITGLDPSPVFGSVNLAIAIAIGLGKG